MGLCFDPPESISYRNAQVDVINANGGQASYHPELVEEHLQVILDEAGETKDAYLALDPDAREIIYKKAVKAATEEYLTCLFLHNGDNKRYGPVAERLETDYVLARGEKKNQEGIYPQDRVTMKRVMGDLGGTGAMATKKSNDDAQDDGVAFQQQQRPEQQQQQRKDTREPCGACGRMHKGGIGECRAITDETRKLLLAEAKK